MHLTLQQLKLFEAVARHRSFTRASEELHLTQPAVSIQIKRLEENSGVPLFDQIGKKLYLTAAGDEMFAASRDVLGRLKELDERVGSLQGSVSGPLQISVVTTAKYFIPHLLGAFLHKYPDVKPKLFVTNRQQVIERLNDNEDDLVIMGQVPKNMKVVAEPFLDTQLVVAAPVQHPLTKRKNIPLAELVNERFLVREPGSGTRIAVDNLMAEHGLEITPYMELGSADAIKQGVMADIGLSVLSIHNMLIELEAGHLAVLDVEDFPLHRRWYAAHLAGKKLSLVASTFLEFIRTESVHVLKDVGKHT